MMYDRALSDSQTTPGSMTPSGPTEIGTPLTCNTVGFVGDGCSKFSFDSLPVPVPVNFLIRERSSAVDALVDEVGRGGTDGLQLRDAFDHRVEGGPLVTDIDGLHTGQRFEAARTVLDGRSPVRDVDAAATHPGRSGGPPRGLVAVP